LSSIPRTTVSPFIQGSDPSHEGRAKTGGGHVSGTNSAAELCVEDIRNKEEAMKIAFLGTGLMGRPMAERLLSSGHLLVVYNRTREKAEPLASAGAELAATPRAAMTGAELVILMLADAAAVEQTVFANPTAPRLPAGLPLIQMGTISPRQSLGFKERWVKAGGEYLEAPVLGSTPQAREGNLVVMVGATKDQYERWLPVLERFSPDPLYIGPVGKASALKLALNQLIASQTAAFSFSLGLVRRNQIDVDQFMKILRSSSLFAPAFDQKLPRYLRRDFSSPHFPTRHLLKDVRLILEEGEAAGLATAALEGVRTIVEKAVAEGLGEADYSSIYEAVDPAV
jgi:3-hydroxyisobutyrate dehydrogenase